jgi:hypothetical protein
LTVTGLPIDSKDHYFDPAGPMTPETIEGRVRQLLPAGPQSHRLLASGPMEQHAYDYRGSPVLNPQGEAVAVFTRVSLRPPYENDPQPSDTFDAPLIAQVLECLGDADEQGIDP